MGGEGGRGRGPVSADVKIGAGKEAFSTLGPTKGSAHMFVWGRGGGGADRDQLSWGGFDDRFTGSAACVRALTQVGAAASRCVFNVSGTPGGARR